MDWLNDVMARCGDLVDFLSWHTYPLRRSQTREEMLRLALDEPRRIAGSFHRLVERYQPDRADEIDLGVSEWNLGLEGGMEVDMFGAIWTALFVGSMLENGIDFANQWDAFTHNAGGSLLHSQEPLARKAQYWVFWLWNHYMADGVLECTTDGPDTLHVFATRSDDAVCLMAINASEYDESTLQVNLDGFSPAREGESALLSRRGTFWDRLNNRLLWSGGPQVDPIAVGPSFSVAVPPMSIRCIRIPSADNPVISERAEQRRGMEGKDFGPAELRILMEDSGYEDTPVKGWVLAFLPGTDEPYPVPLPNARLSVSGPAEPERAEVRLAEAAGPFVLKPNGPGEATVTASLGEEATTVSVELVPSVPKPVVLWEFESERLGRGYRSHWDLSTDDSVRANQRVARIDLKGVVPDQEHRELLVMDIPRRAPIDRANIRGVFFDLSVSRDFQCDDPNAGIQIVMQSPDDYWMQLGNVALPEAGDRWQTHTVPVTQENHIRAMHAAYNVWFILHSEKPVTGAIFIDHAGLMIR
jgi:hypothetical protein